MRGRAEAHEYFHFLERFLGRPLTVPQLCRRRLTPLHRRPLRAERGLVLARAASIANRTRLQWGSSVRMMRTDASRLSSTLGIFSFLYRCRRRSNPLRPQ